MALPCNWRQLGFCPNSDSHPSFPSPPPAFSSGIWPIAISSLGQWAHKEGCRRLFQVGTWILWAMKCSTGRWLAHTASNICRRTSKHQGWYRCRDERGGIVILDQPLIKVRYSGASSYLAEGGAVGSPAARSWEPAAWGRSHRLPDRCNRIRPSREACSTRGTPACGELAGGCTWLSESLLA